MAAQNTVVINQVNFLFTLLLLLSWDRLRLGMRRELVIRAGVSSAHPSFYEERPEHPEGFPCPSLVPRPVLGILIFGYHVLPLFDRDDGRGGLRSFFCIVLGNFLTPLRVIVYGILELDTDDSPTLQDFLLVVHYVK